jgi:hypothetical protein
MTTALLAATMTAAIVATASIVAAARIVAATTGAIATAAEIAQHGGQPLKRERLRRHTHKTDRQHGGQHTALHGRLLK